MNNPESVKVIEQMQKKLLHIRHPSLVGYHAVAVEEEKPNIKFLVVEESFPKQSSITLRNLVDRISNNSLLMQFFEEKTYLWKIII